MVDGKTRNSFMPILATFLVLVMMSTAQHQHHFVTGLTTATDAHYYPLQQFVRQHHHQDKEEDHSRVYSCPEIMRAFAYDVPKSVVDQLAPHQGIYQPVCDWYMQHHEKKTVEGLLGLNYTLPQQIHLSIVKNDPTQVGVLWTTSTVSNGSTVCWWEKKKSLSHKKGGQNNKDNNNKMLLYSSSDEEVEKKQCADGISWTYHPISVIPWEGTLHSATMNSLTPGQDYCYIVGDKGLNASSSEEICFVAPEFSPSTKNEIFVAVGGDMGSVQLFGFKVAKQMRDEELKNNYQLDAFWHLGDIAYSTLDPPKLNFEFFWDMYMQQEESYTNHIPMLVTYGNHDFSGGDSGAYLNRYRNPSSSSSVVAGGVNPYYWSYNHGPVRYVSMCTEVGLVPSECNYAPGSTQYQWLETQFSTINRTQTPWLILAGHRPMYSSDASTDSGALRRDIEPLLLKYKVDLELGGHMHETEVISPVANHTAQLNGVTQVSANSWLFNQPEAPCHVTIGTLGALIKETFTTPKPAWSMFRSGNLFGEVYGYATMKVNRTDLSFTFFKESDNSILWALNVRK